MPLMKVNAKYEDWLRGECDLVKENLKRKNVRMRRNSFVFLRSTYLRWARSIEEICPALFAAPSVLAVGDIHVENFGTWRDADGRLVWGVNDFDEAAVMPFTLDLPRPATSVTVHARNNVCQHYDSHTLIQSFIQFSSDYYIQYEK
jgi:uncharacterized protein (DUF2252 family)